jgi:HEAT repeat protein
VRTPFEQTAELLDDPSAEIRQKAVRELYEMDPDRAATLVNDALRDGSPEERRRIGSALADSGLLYEAIDDLMAENHESCYGAFSLLFLVAKAGVVEPLSSVIEKHPSLDLSLAIIRLLASSGEPEVASTLQRLASNDSLAPELRSAAAESFNQLRLS